jgi:hypothetical protein
VCDLKSTKSEIESIIERLETAINVCTECDGTNDDDARSYPYAAGYSRIAMIQAVDNLRQLM